MKLFYYKVNGLVWREQQIRKRYKFLVAALIIFFAFDFCFGSGFYVFAQTDQTALKLQVATNDVNSAFNAVLAAEKAGADVI